MSEYLAMRQAFAKAYGKPEDKHVPSKEYAEKKLSELSKGHTPVKKGSSTVAMPSKPEQLRLRLSVMCNAIRMLKLKRPATRDKGRGRRPLRDLQRIPAG